MATLTKTFCRESKKAHDDHYVLNEELRSLNLALEHLGSTIEDIQTLTAAKQVQMIAGQLAGELPDHFLHEDVGILTTVAEVSPQLNYFAQEMRRQHDTILQSLARFRHEIEAMKDADDMSAMLRKVRTAGQTFSRELSQHIAAEEEELKGFL